MSKLEASLIATPFSPALPSEASNHPRMGHYPNPLSIVQLLDRRQYWRAQRNPGTLISELVPRASDLGIRDLSLYP